MPFLQIISSRAKNGGQPLALPVLLSVLLCLLWPASGYSAQTNEPLPQEYGLKSIFLYNFLQFVHWPAKKCPQIKGMVKEIAVLGDSPIGESLQALKTQLKESHNVDITVRYLGPYVDGMDLSGCRLLFITKSEMKNARKILAGLKDEPTLTVADTEEFFEQGCMIVLLSRLNKVRWAVNRKPAEQAGLRLNSRMLAMAIDITE